jgi:Uma2 family endonuclease
MTTGLPPTWSIADLLEHFGNISPRRIRLHPAPGTATEKDLLAIQAREDRLYELIDGVLVEKVMCFRESCLAALMIRLLGNFVAERDRGLITAPDGTLRLAPRLVGIPDVAFISWSRLRGRKYPEEPIPDLVPDLAVEILSKGNTPEEMLRKLKDYFLAGVRLVWFVDPEERVVDVYTAPDESTRLVEGDTLDGGDVLTGFRLPLNELFARVSGAARPRRPGKQNGRKKGR